MDGKKCNKCGEIKPPSEYHINNALTDGLASRCKICVSNDAKARRRNNLKLSPLEASNDPLTIEGTRNLLSSIGYELDNPNNPVYHQFKKQIELKYGVILDQIKEGS